jgi:hypothetical protein
MRDKESRFIFWKDGPNIVSAVAVVAAVYIAWSQLTAANEQLRAQAQTASASYVLQLRGQLDNDRFQAIMNAIEDHPGDFALLKNDFKTNDIDDYIGQFETIGALVHDGIVNEAMAYGEFAYDIEKAYCNKDVQVEVDDMRKADGVATGPQAFFTNFTGLAERFLKRDKKQCKDLDNE